MQKLKQTVQLILSFVIGMVIIAHWNEGRRFIRDLSPFVDDSLSSTARELFEQGKRDIKKESVKALERTKDYLENN